MHQLQWDSQIACQLVPVSSLSASTKVLLLIVMAALAAAATQR